MFRLEQPLQFIPERVLVQVRQKHAQRAQAQAVSSTDVGLLEPVFDELAAALATEQIPGRGAGAGAAS